MAEAAASADRRASPAVGWGLIVVGLAIAAGFALVAQVVAKMPLAEAAGMTALVSAVTFVPMALIALLFAHIDGFATFRAGVAPGRWAAVGFASGLGGLAFAAGLAALAGSLVEGQGAAIGGLIGAGALLILLQAGIEELFFRGWLLEALDGRIDPRAAIALSSPVFAGFHVLGGAVAPMALVNLVLGGVWFALLARRSGGLVAPLLAHFAWNAGEELVAGLSPNPGIGPFGALMDWDLAGSPLWGGSAEGLNTSIGMAIVLLALIVPLAWRRAR